MHLTNFTDYSLRTLMYLMVHPQKLSSVKEIAEYYDISRSHLVKIVHHLSQLGYLETSKGKGGGIRLADKAQTVRLGDLISQLEPHMFIAECFNTEKNTCRLTESCRLKHHLFEARHSFVETLNQYTLADTI